MEEKDGEKAGKGEMGREGRRGRESGFRRHGWLNLSLSHCR